MSIMQRNARSEDTCHTSLFFVSGPPARVPYSWLANAPAGKVIIDPTVATGATEDVWLEDGGNKDGGTTSSAGLLLAKAMVGVKKRILVKFDLAAAGIPSNATVVHARLNLKYYSAISTGSNITWQERPVQVHQMLVDWAESEATRDIRLLNVPWNNNISYGAINGTDAKAAPEDVVTIQQDHPRPVGWNLTELAQQWVSGTAPNYGVILWATSEDTPAYDLRFRSTDDGQPEQPELEILWYEPVRSVYYLKDHLGSVRATVDDIGEVVAYDDYGPWGMTLAGRSMNFGQAELPNKFTGKERDTDFGLDWDYFERGIMMRRWGGSCRLTHWQAISMMSALLFIRLIILCVSRILRGWQEKMKMVRMMGMRTRMVKVIFPKELHSLVSKTFRRNRYELLQRYSEFKTKWPNSRNNSRAPERWRRRPRQPLRMLLPMFRWFLL